MCPNKPAKGKGKGDRKGKGKGKGIYQLNEWSEEVYGQEEDGEDREEGEYGAWGISMGTMIDSMGTMIEETKNVRWQEESEKGQWTEVRRKCRIGGHGGGGRGL